MQFETKRTPAGLTITGFAPGVKLRRLVLPEEIDGIPVAAIDEEAFIGAGFEAVEAPSIRQVGHCAFRDCRNLRSVSLPQAVDLGSFSLAGCGALETLDMPMLRTLGVGCFEGAGLREAAFDHITQIGAYCFAKCRRLRSLVFGDNCTFNIIPRNLVADCNMLTELKYPADRIVSIGKHAFRATRLEEIDLSAPSIIRLDWCVAYDCRRLTAFHFPPHISYESSRTNPFNLQDFSLSPHVKIYLPTAARDIYLKGVKDNQIVYYDA